MRYFQHLGLIITLEFKSKEFYHVHEPTNHHAGKAIDRVVFPTVQARPLLQNDMYGDFLPQQSENFMCYIFSYTDLTW